MPAPASESTVADETAVGRAFAALRHRNYRLFWIGAIISNSGRFFQVLAIPAIVWQLTESAAWVGLAGFAQLIPMALIGPVSGALADRHDRRRLLLVTQSAQAVSSAVFMAMWWGGARSPTAYVVVSVLAGVTAGLNLPAWQAFVSELVPRELLLNAVTLNSMQFNASRMIGPVLAGVTLAGPGPGWAFFVNTISYGAVLAALVLIDTPRRLISSGERMQPIRDFVATISYIGREPGISAAVMAVFLIGMFGLPIQILSVVFAEDVYDRGPSGFGLMLTMIGVGAVLFSPVLASIGGRIPRSRILAVALTGYGVAIVVFAVVPMFWLSLVGLAGVGAAHLTCASTLNTAIQLQVTEQRRAKVLSVYLRVLLIANPIGQLTLGQLMETIGPREVIGAAGVVMLLAAVGLRVSGRLAALDAETGSYEPEVVPEAHPTYPVAPRASAIDRGPHQEPSSFSSR